MNFKLFVESKGSWIWIGDFDDDNNLRAKRIFQKTDFELDPDFDSRLKTHENVFGAYYDEMTSWRYREGTNTIFWWYKPNKYHKEAVQEFLAKKGFHNLGTAKTGYLEISKPSMQWKVPHGFDKIPLKWQYKTIGDSVIINMGQFERICEKFLTESPPKSYLTFKKQADKIAAYCLKAYPDRAKSIREWHRELLHGFTWDDGYRGMTDKQWVRDCLMYDSDMTFDGLVGK